MRVRGRAGVVRRRRRSAERAREGGAHRPVERLETARARAMRGVPPSPSWYGAGLACATGTGMSSTRLISAWWRCEGDGGAVRGQRGRAVARAARARRALGVDARRG